MTGKAETLVRLRSSAGALGALLDGRSDEQLCEQAMDGWSVRDLAAHFAGYHSGMAEAIERIGRGESPGQGDGLTDDERNAAYAQEARARPVPDVMREWREAFERCCGAAEALPDERFGEGRSVRRWLLEEADHYDGHSAQVRDWLSRT